ncbi:Smoothelin-like protein 2 [Merluccius polli]|uniref:Smoothelin-like protein 2 n=1 Tax=Merluccius polli TaxID=89951 RepID=A0AA47NWC8_MERPO|nr:Smoothelin-like protein 2 [Merluccius polli]
MPRSLVIVVPALPAAMEEPALNEIGPSFHRSTPPPLPAPEGGETVCAALARYETTLRDAIREIHVDVSAFKLGVERRLEEAAGVSRAMAQLQQENRQLRAQLDTLAQQVELLTGRTCEHQGVTTTTSTSNISNNSNHSNGTSNHSLNHHHHHNHHNNHHGDMQLHHQEITEVVHGKGQVQFPTQGSPAQTHMCPRGQTGSPPPSVGFSSSPEPVSPTLGTRVTSMVTSGPGFSDSPSTARFSSRATFALSSKTNTFQLLKAERRFRDRSDPLALPEDILYERYRFSSEEDILYERYRFSSEDIRYLIVLVGPYEGNATKRSRAQFGDAENISKNTVCLAIRKVVAALNTLLNMFFVFPNFLPTQTVKEGFYQLMRISTSKSESMVLNRKRVECTLRVGDEILPQVEEFKYLGVLFTSEGRMEREIDRRIGAASAVMRTLHGSVVVKRELSRKAKLSIYQSIYVPALTYGHEL